MASIHNLLSRGTWSAALKRALGVVKPDGGIERYGETMTPVVNLWGLPEWAYLREEQLWAARESAGAVAAEGSMVGVSNPANSGKILTIDVITGRSDTAQTLNLGLALETQLSATLTAGNGARARDTRIPRLGIAGDPYAVVGVNTWTGSDPTVTFNTVLESVGLTVNTVNFVSAPWVLRPGTALWLQTSTVNTVIIGGFFGRIRAALPGELF